MVEKPKLLINSGLNDEQLTALGAQTCNSSSLDQMLEILIWVLSDFHFDFQAPGAILTDRMGDEQRKKVAKMLAKHLDHFEPGFYAKVSNFVNKFSRLQRRRNELIHAIWSISEHPELAQYAFKVQSQLGPYLKQKKTTLNDLIDSANRAVRLTNECSGLILDAQNIHILRRASRPKPE